MRQQVLGPVHRQIAAQGPQGTVQQWQEVTRAVCAHAYAPYKDGTIHPQLVVGCDDHLNRALLKEFAPLNNCLLYTSPSPRDRQKSRMPSSA